MSYSIELAKDFEQTFDNFSESYQVAVDKTNNTVIGTTTDNIQREARFVRVRLHNTKTFADAPVVGKYPIYGAEEISVIGGLIKSKSIEINYKNKTISQSKLRKVADILNHIEPITNGVITVVNANNLPLSKQDDVDNTTQVIVSNATNSLVERYFVQ